MSPAAIESAAMLLHLCEDCAEIDFPIVALEPIAIDPRAEPPHCDPCRAHGIEKPAACTLTIEPVCLPT